MSVVAVIPARGGSKGLPGKNLALVGGRPLVERAVAVARACTAIDRVVVSTDDVDIARVAAAGGAEVVERPIDLAGDLASSESAVLHALDAIIGGDRSDVVVLIQCTSPFIDPDDLAQAVRRAEADASIGTIFSAAESHDFVWTANAEQCESINHDASQPRERRQDRAPQVVETGAFYVMRANALRASGSRFNGRVVHQLVPGAHRIEIDDADDHRRAQLIAEAIDPLGPATLIGALVEALVTDFDGVHTDNTAMVDEHGVEAVRVHRGDGMGLSMLRRSGVRTLILSTEQNPVVQRRADKLGVDCIYGADDKLAALSEWARGHALDLGRVAYVGNDVNDLACLLAVGRPIIVADAHPSLRSIPGALVTQRRGGEGAVREVTDALLCDSNRAHLSPASPVHV